MILGILCATIANHTCAGFAGVWLRGILSTEMLRWFVGISFLAIAAWTLVPDRMDENRAPADGRSTSSSRSWRSSLPSSATRAGGDAEALRTYDSLVAEISGSTLGMLCADAPAVALGAAAPFAIPLRAVRLAASALFGALGAAALLGFRFF